MVTHGNGLCGADAGVCILGWLCAFFIMMRFGWTTNIIYHI